PTWHRRWTRCDGQVALRYEPLAQGRTEFQVFLASSALYISEVRYKIYQDIFAELSAIRHW
ncbi:MAG: hypothetical protein Q7U45_09135, partial [Burkholderiaceae bacterium]|nr:hypothetical protein [Burkholderiaceae bacterium]